MKKLAKKLMKSPEALAGIAIMAIIWGKQIHEFGPWALLTFPAAIAVLFACIYYQTKGDSGSNGWDRHG